MAIKQFLVTGIVILFVVGCASPRRRAGGGGGGGGGGPRNGPGSQPGNGALDDLQRGDDKFEGLKKGDANRARDRFNHEGSLSSGSPLINGIGAKPPRRQGPFVVPQGTPQPPKSLDQQGARTPSDQDGAATQDPKFLGEADGLGAAPGLEQSAPPAAGEGTGRPTHQPTRQ